MNFVHFGNLLKYIRTSNNLTIEALASDICSNRQLHRIESGECEPSLYIINKLSIKLNMDLQEYYKIHYSMGSLKANSYSDKIDTLIINKDYKSLRELIGNIESLDEFKSDECLQMVLYSKALCCSILDKDYQSTIEYCYEGLKVDVPDFDVNDINDKIFSNTGLTLLNLLSTSYSNINDADMELKIAESLFYILENRILNSPIPMYRSLEFPKKLYQAVSNNLGTIYRIKEQHTKALEFYNKGINLAIKENNMRFLPELTRNKARSLYKIGKIKDSYENYEISLSLFKLLKNEKRVVSLGKEIEERNFKDLLNI